MSRGYGPDRRERAIVLTFDNLGEASALQRGEWTPQTPLGSDPSVTQALPRLLDVLDHSGLSATFFVEGLNAELNPGALREIVSRGHELGAHGWQHETWGELEPAAERELLERAGRAFAALGLGARGFRPPGGELTAQTPGLLRALGFAWCSPLGAGPAVRDGLAYVPFDWDLVDAYHLMDHFGALRSGRGDPAAPLDPAAAGERMGRALAGGGGVQTVILHPFLMLDGAWWGQAQRVLALIAQLARDGRAWVVPGGRFAQWLVREVGSGP